MSCLPSCLPFGQQCGPNSAAYHLEVVSTKRFGDEQGSGREELISSLIVMLSEPLHLKSAATPDHECVCVWGEDSGKAKA